MAIEIYIAIALLTAGASYMQAKKAQKKAKELTEGVEANIESNSKEIPVVYGKRRVGGTRVYIDTSRDKKHQYLYMVLAMAEGEVESITDIKIDDVSIDDARFNYDGNLNQRNLEFEVFLGSDDQEASTMIGDGTSYDYDRLGEIYNDPFADQHERDAQDPNRVLPWSSKHRLRGVAYLALKFKWDENAYNGIPDVTAVVKGRKVYNPDTGVTEWSDNPALCIRDYLTNERFGKGLPASAIDDVAFIKAANDLDGFIAYPYQDSPSYQYLFRMNHVVDTSKKIMENLNDMIVACRGFIPYSNGVYSLKIDQTSSSVLDISPDQIISGVGIAGARKEDRFNQVKVNFFNASSNYKEDQAIYPEENSTLYQQYLAEDEGEPLVDEVDLYSIDNYYSAREMARLFLERSRQNMTIGFQGTSELINLEVGEVVSITHPTPEWVDKLFQVQEVALAFDGTVQITCIEYDADLYTYDTPDEEQPYVGTRLPDPNQVDPPTALSTATGTYIEADGKAIGYIDLSWSAPEDSLVDRYEIKFEYSSREEVIELASTEYRFKPTQDNVSYVISVRAVNGLGIRSAWLTAAAVTAVVDTTAPSDITGINISAGLQSITLDWTNPTENDFDLVRIKHNTVDDLPSSHSFEVRSDSFVHDIGAYSTTKYYWLAPVDRTGNVGNYVSAGSETTGSIDYSDVGNTPTIPVVPEVATTAYLTLDDDDAPSVSEFNTAVGRNPIQNDFVVVNKEFAFNYDNGAWVAVTEFIDGSLLVSGSLSASDITTGTLNASKVTIENLTVSYSTLTDKPTIPVNVSDLTNDSGFIDDTNVVFSDDLGDYIRLDSVENLLLSFDKYADQETNIDWTGYDSATSDIKVVKSADAVTGGSYLEIGNNDGNDEAWLIHDRNIPFDPSQTYRVTVRAKQTAGSGTAYFGFAGVASDGTTLVNYIGNNNHSSQHYFAGAGEDIPTAWTEYVGYVKGVSSTGTSSQKSDYNDPAVMHEDTRFVRPLILVNYSDASGVTLIDSFKIEAISANPNAIQGNEVDANVTEISGGVIQAGSQITVGTGNNIGALSGSDSTFRIWAGHATASSAPFRVSQAGVLNATGAVIDGNVTAQSLDVENATVTGTFIAPIGWSESVYSGVINRGNLNESVKDLIDERIAEVTGGISGDFGQDDGSFSYIAQGNPDPVDPTVLNITHENGKDLTVELSGSRSWNRQFIGLPDTDMGVTIILERSPAGADTWTTLTTLTDSGSSITTSGPTLIHSSTYAYSISIYHVLTDDQASGNYDYRARTTVAGSAYSVGVPIQLTVVEPATVGAGNADTLDNEDGTYYLNYNNFTNTPTIPDLSTKANLSGDTFTGTAYFQDGVVVSNGGSLKLYDDGHAGDLSDQHGVVYYDSTDNSLRFYAIDINGNPTGVTAFQRYSGSSYYNVWDAGNFNPDNKANSADPTLSGTVTIDNGGVLRFDTSTTNAHQRADARVESETASRLHWYGVLSDQSTSNFRHAWYDGSNYINVTASGGVLSFDGVGFNSLMNVDGGYQVAGNTVINLNQEGRFSNVGVTNIVTNTIVKFDGTKFDDSGLTDDGSKITSSRTTFINGRMYGGMGAMTTGGTTDWNHSSNARSGSGYTLLLGSHDNGMGSGTYYHPFSFEYNSKDGTGNMTQFAIPYGATDNIYFRSRYSDTWTGWTKVLDSNDTGTGNGLDADTVDGVHAVSFTRKDSNGQYLRPYNSYPSYLTTQTANTLSNQMGGDGGIRVDFINGQSFGTWGHCLTWSGYHAYNMYQLAGYYHVNGQSDLWFRSEKDHTNDEWTAWNKIYHTGNDGSGSGLDADLLDGNHGSHYTSFGNQSGEHRGNITLSFRPQSSTTYAGFQFKTEGASNAGYLLTRGDSNNDIYASNGITLVSDLDWLTLANRTGSTGVRIMTGTSASTRMAILDDYTEIKTHTNIGNTYQSNDGGWNGRLNVSGALHSRIDARAVNDGITMSMFAHTGQNGKVGTMSNHALSFIVNASAKWTIYTDGRLATDGLSVAGLADGGIRSSAQIDSADVTSGTFRIYNGSTFRGGFGTARWAIGAAGAVDDMAVFSTGSHIELAVNSGSTRQYVSDAGVELSSGGFTTPNGTNLIDRALHLYSGNGSRVNCDVRDDAGFCTPHKFTYNGSNYGQYKENWWDGDSYHKIQIVSGVFNFGGGITTTGNITAYSDISLKDNIEVISDSLSKVAKLRGVTYDRTDLKNERHAGVIAQEVEQVLPEVVTIDQDGIKSVAYGNMVGLLIEAIKELKTEIEVLKNGNN